MGACAWVPADWLWLLRDADPVGPPGMGACAWVPVDSVMDPPPVLACPDEPELGLTAEPVPAMAIAVPAFADPCMAPAGPDATANGPAIPEDPLPDEFAGVVPLVLVLVLVLVLEGVDAGELG